MLMEYSDSQKARLARLYKITYGLEVPRIASLDDLLDGLEWEYGTELPPSASIDERLAAVETPLEGYEHD